MSRIIQIEERLVVGAAESGHELLASMVGQYFAEAFGIEGIDSLTVAAQAQDLVEWNELVPSTLNTGYHTETNPKQNWGSIEAKFKGFAEKIIYMKRDPKDCVALLLKRTGVTEVTDQIIVDEVARIETMKLRLDTLGTEYTTVDFDYFVEHPHIVLTKAIHMLKPIEGMRISQAIIDKVVDQSQIRGLRFEANESPLMERVGSYSEIITREHALLIDQLATEAGL